MAFSVAQATSNGFINLASLLLDEAMSGDILVLVLVLVVTPMYRLLPLTHYSKDISSLSVFGQLGEGQQGSEQRVGYLALAARCHKEAWLAKEGRCSLPGHPVSTETKRLQTD